MPRSPQVNFYLKPVDEDGKAVVFLQFKYSGKRFFFSSGEKIKPADWNINKQRPKRKDLTTNDGSHSLSELLDNLQSVCEKAYIAEKVKGIPDTEVLRKRLQDFLHHNIEDPKQQQESALFALIDRFINKEIKNKGKLKTDNTIKAYRTARKSLKEFEDYTNTTSGNKNYRLGFDGITLDFFYKYVTFLEKNNYKQNTLAKYIQTLKVFMGEAVDLGLTTNLQYKHRKFVVERVETDAVYLNEKELDVLYKHDFSANKRLDQVRDLFIFGAWVGLRFSDYSNVKPENIVMIDGEYFVKIITQKTKGLVVVPCNPVVLEIFEKYKANKNKLPPAISNQKFNEYVKEVCELAGLKENGRLSTDPKLELWECVSSHTARRSFATNYYLQGFPTIDLMKITGHTTEKVFLNYIKVSKLDTAKRLSKHIKMWTEKTERANETLLKAV